MATKVCKLKDGNEIISDIKEIRNKEDQPIAYLLTSPYRVEHYLDEDDYFGREEIDDDGDDYDDTEEVDTQDLVAEPDGTLSLDMGRMDTGIPDEPFQLDKIRLQFYPWCPLAKDNRIHIPLDFLVTAYDAHPEVEKKYKDLIDRMYQLQEEEELDEIDGDDEEEAINPEVMLDEEESDE